MSNNLESLIKFIESTNDIESLKLDISKFSKTKETLNLLELILRSQDNNINTRAKALRLLYEIDNYLSKDLLILCTQDIDPIIRMESCGMLSYYPPEEKISNQLEKILVSDVNVDVRLVALFALKNTGTLSAIKSIEWARENDIEENWEGRRVSHSANRAIDAIKSRAGN